MPELIRNYCFVLVEILCCKIFLIGDVALREKKLYENARLEIQAENQWLMYQKMTEDIEKQRAIMHVMRQRRSWWNIM